MGVSDTNHHPSEDHSMDDVGKKKSGFGKEAAEAVASLLGCLLLFLIIYEAGSRLGANDSTVTIYQQAKCRLWRSIVESKLSVLDDRLGDVEREMMRTKPELTIAEGAVLQALRQGTGTREAEAALAVSITERERLAAHLDDLRKLRASLLQIQNNLDSSRRRASVEIARLEARFYNP
jgi:hypothetical protein